MTDQAQDQTHAETPKRRGRQPGQAARKLDEVDVMSRSRKLIETLAPQDRALVAAYLSRKYGHAQAPA